MKFEIVGSKTPLSVEGGALVVHLGEDGGFKIPADPEIPGLEALEPKGFQWAGPRGLVLAKGEDDDTLFLLLSLHHPGRQFTLETSTTSSIVLGKAGKKDRFVLACIMEPKDRLTIRFSNRLDLAKMLQDIVDRKFDEAEVKRISYVWDGENLTQE